MSEALTEAKIRAIVRDELECVARSREERLEDHWTRSPYDLSPESFDEDFAARFWEKVDKAGPISPARPDLGPCWIWTGARYNHGAGKVRWGREATLMAHRVGWVLFHGQALPGDKTIDHLCETRGCVRGDHLEPASILENMRHRSRCVSTINRMKEACAKGHPFDDRNTYVTTDNGRQVRKCRTCRAAVYERRKAAQHAAPRAPRPDAATLAAELEQFTAVELAARYGVSDRMIGKWALAYGLKGPGHGNRRSKR